MITFITLLFAALCLVPLGCVALWKKYVYFADGLAHTALLTIIIANSFALHPLIGAFIVAIIFASLVFKFQRSEDSGATIALISSFLISLAVIINYISPTPSDLKKLLFGNVNYATESSIATLIVLLLLIYFYLYKFYKPLILSSLSADFAKVKKINTTKIDLVYLILLAITVFASLKIIGGLLLSGFLIIAPLCSSLISSSTQKMIILSSVLAVIFIILGFVLNIFLKLPISPLIILIASICYFIIFFINKYKKKL